MPLMAALGLGLLLIGFGFKVAAVPFHMWAPDVYDGCADPGHRVHGDRRQGGGVRRAGARADRGVPGGASPSGSRWWPGSRSPRWWSGNLVALAQRSLKRMLAYSSIAHAGYLLVARLDRHQWARAAVLFYLLAYASDHARELRLPHRARPRRRARRHLDDIAGLSPTRPWIALALSVCMLSLLGFPGTFGFIGKWYILTASWPTAAGDPAGRSWCSPASLSAGYYLPVIMAMYMQPGPGAPSVTRRQARPHGGGLDRRRRSSWCFSSDSGPAGARLGDQRGRPRSSGGAAPSDAGAPVTGGGPR